MKQFFSLVFFLLVALASCFSCSSSGSSSADVSAFLQCFHNASSSSMIGTTKHDYNASIVYTPHQTNFSSVLLSYIKNLRFATKETPKPLAIITPHTPKHVQATILCAKIHSLQVRTRSGGHDYEGLSYVSHLPFIILDMFNMRQISIDLNTETAWVQTGATLGELYYSISQKSNVHAFPAGTCPSVGIGGHIAGGGYGNLMRKYGLSIDQAVDASIVDANGRILNRKAMGEDLFWAIRGGGGPSFGVILSWKLNLVRVPKTVTVFKVTKSLEQNAVEAIDQWQDLAAKDVLDKNIFIKVVLRTQNSKFTAEFFGMFLGYSENLVPVLQDEFPLLGLSNENCIGTSWIKSTLFWYNIPLNTSTEILLKRVPTPESNFKLKSDYVKTLIPRSGLEAISNKMTQLGVNLYMDWNPYGGRMAEIPSTETAFPHRAGNLWKIQYIADWKEARDTERYLEATREMYEFMTPYVSMSPRATYLNCRDLDIGAKVKNHTDFSYGHKYFKENFDRLIRTKTAVDPGNFFENEQSIPTIYSM